MDLEEQPSAESTISDDIVSMQTDSRRVRTYFFIVSGTCWMCVWGLWFMLGFMGSRSSPDGVTLFDLLRATLYSLPVAMVLSAVFPMVVMGERHKRWVVDATGIKIYQKEALILTVAWDEVDDVIFREFSVGIYLRGRSPDEYDVFLPSPDQCERMSVLYNKARGVHSDMDEHH